MTLTEFLTARLNEDEASAEEVLPYVADDGAKIVISLTRREGNEWWSKEVSPYDPKRALVEVAAKRMIIALHPKVHVCRAVDFPIAGEITETMTYGGCGTLRHLASTYADHPDYLEEWRP